MEQHPHLDMLVHTTEELAGHVGEPVAAREQLHAWPLSSVELLTTASGRRLVYKVQREPTVEPELLAGARSPLLPACATLQRDGRQAATLMPFIAAPTLAAARGAPEAELAERCRAVVALVGQVAWDGPVYRDLGSPAAWRAFAGETLGLLRALVARGALPRVTAADADLLERWAAREDVLACVARTSQLITGDLKADHVFLTEGGPVVIDWQRPYRAPAEVDLALLLESLGVPPERHVAPAALGLRWFLLVHWAAEAKAHLLPQLPFFDAWVRAGVDRIGAL